MHFYGLSSYHDKRQNVEFWKNESHIMPLAMYLTLIAIVLKGVIIYLISMIDWYLMISSAIVELYLFSDGPVDIQIGALLTRHCGVSDIQVTIKAHGPLVYYHCCICFFY